MARRYLSAKILADIRICPGSDEKELQFGCKKKTIDPEIMSQKISQMIVHVERDNA